jgi:hypothetical protein
VVAADEKEESNKEEEEVSLFGCSSHSHTLTHTHC